MSSWSYDTVELERQQQRRLEEQRQERIAALAALTEIERTANIQLDQFEFEGNRMLEEASLHPVLQAACERIRHQQRMVIEHNRRRSVLPDDGVVNHEKYMQALTNYRLRISAVNCEDLHEQIKSRCPREYELLHRHAQRRRMAADVQQTHFLDCQGSALSVEALACLKKNSSQKQRMDNLLGFCRTIDRNCMTTQQQVLLDQLLCQAEQKRDSVLNELAELLSTIKNFEDEYRRYAAMCRYASIPAKSAVDFEGEQAVKEAAALLEEEIRQRDERQYISDAISSALKKNGLGDGVMIEMRGGECTLFMNNDSTALRVQHNAQGVFIEPVTVDRSHAKPGLKLSGRLTTAQVSSAVARAQQQYCGGIRERLVNDLMEAGVIVTSSRLIPAMEMDSATCVVVDTENGELSHNRGYHAHVDEMQKGAVYE